MPKRDDYVSASDLARLGYCERQVAFDAACGEASTPQQREDRSRGTAAHKSFYDEGRRIANRSAKRGYCFVATLALGECEETNALRAWRDLYLRRSIIGRRLIHLYYLVSPRLSLQVVGKEAGSARGRACGRQVVCANRGQRSQGEAGGPRCQVKWQLW
ncbi:hypothetical protein Bpfe_031065 [Biomphalaria pfeifferi]|uniref:Uncharacterized protein n=1 Tax=Biomphalaria pfeifferi TaxID=112525 RepID=A0AAD8ANN2_BIOPF|nr:hypothetical protein Bpfe_031065 [Biomphalaria pfeifferi]